jgi:hypothetical protein
MQCMTGVRYEALVQAMVQEFKEITKDFGTYKVKGGTKNHFRGASRFPHQIDVTISNPTDLLLIECKCLEKEKVEAEPVLVLAARICDIRAANPTTRVHGSIVSMREVSSGARLLAKYFCIEIDTVRNLHEYAIRVFNHIFAGFLETAQATDTLNADVTSGNGG